MLRKNAGVEMLVLAEARGTPVHQNQFRAGLNGEHKTREDQERKIFCFKSGRSCKVFSYFPFEHLKVPHHSPYTYQYINLV